MPLHLLITALFIQVFSVIHPNYLSGAGSDHLAISLINSSPGGGSGRVPLADPVVTRTSDEAREIIELKVPGEFSHPVVAQPRDEHLFVSEDPDSLTQFQLATPEGSYGLLAHNYLAGENFFDLKGGDPIFLFFNDGSVGVYQVAEIVDFRTLSPYSYSDLETGQKYSDVKLFEEIYSGNGDKLILQTCITRDGSQTWGLHFVIAMRVDA